MTKLLSRVLLGVSYIILEVAPLQQLFSLRHSCLTIVLHPYFVTVEIY